MSSSTVLSVPRGTINEFCINQLSGWRGETPTCANETRGTKEEDFQTICCDGWIIDTTQDLWRYDPTANRSEMHVDLANLVCCAAHGEQAGGLQPLMQGDGLTCTTGEPTPLASLAATNTDNAAFYLATYTGAQGGSQSGTYNPTLTDYIPTQTPYCLWAATVGMKMQNVTVPAALITTPPAATTDEFGYPITTGTFAPNTTSYSPFATTSAAITSSTPSAANPAVSPSPMLTLLVLFAAFTIARSA